MKFEKRLPAAFHWLNVTQFLGALNDNVFKLLLIFVLVDVQGEGAREKIISLSSALFVIPFILFAQTAGVLADRVSKQRIILATKWTEVGIMLLGALAIAQRSPALIYGTLFLTCVQSAFGSPSTYGIIPELVGSQRLSRANSYLVGCTYLAIILGTTLPSFMMKTVVPGSPLAVAGVSVGIAVVGLLAAMGITRTPPGREPRPFTPFFFIEVTRTLLRIRRDRDLLLAILASAYFLFIGGFLQQGVLLYGRVTLGLDWLESGYLFPLAAIGIGIGSLLAGRFSGCTIEFGIVPLAAAGLTAVVLLMGTSSPDLNHFRALVVATGVCSGLFIVPLNAFIQYRSPPNQRGEIMACDSFLGFVGVALSAALIYLLTGVLHLTPAASFIVLAALTAILTVAALIVLPDFLVRFLGMLITRTFYRLRVEGLDFLPAQGSALLVANHITRLDALFLSCLQPRRIRFLMGREIYDRTRFRWLFRLMGVIPISPADGPRRLVESFKIARQAMDDGFLVCVFPEGMISRNGTLRPFRPGFERIVRGSRYPIVPVYIGGGWGSIFSYFHGRPLGGPPRRIPYPVTLVFGPPLPPNSTARDAEDAVLELSVRWFDLKKSRRRTLGRAFAMNARRYWFRPAVSDSLGRRLTFGRTLVAAVGLRRILERRLRPDEASVGLILPASVAGVVANAAVTLGGRTAVNLNVTVSQAAFDTAIARSNLRTILSSRAFLAKFKAVQPPPGTLMIEDLLAEFTGPARLRAFLAAAAAPLAWLTASRFRPGPDSTATVIFSSGSTGQPKGVMLSHHNILSNVEAFSSVFRFKTADRMCGILPLFHSFGYTTSLWCPLVCGFSAHYHPNPLDAATVVQAIRDEKLTVLLATPTFLSSYMRKADPKDFASLRAVVAGAEKLKKPLADAFEAKFGIRPLEGYGASELSPVVGVSLADVTVDGVTHVGAKEGSIGHPIPGVIARVVDPSTRERLGTNAEGLLLIRGPNVMQGYLGEPEKTAEVLREGWYDTGDIARVDEDGFIFLVDRLSRFSKIGGEMVPHMAIEERLMHSLRADLPCLAVTAVPDDRKGEQLVLLYTGDAGDEARIESLVKASDMPNLWKPRPENFFKVNELPHLGSGKLDLRGIKDLASRLVQSRPESEATGAG